MNALATYRGLLANRPLTRLLGGEFVSAIGDWLYIVALLVVIYRESGDPLVLGLFGAARVVPYIVLSIPAGIAADRFDRRLILLVTDLARGAAMLAMAWVVATGGPIWLLVVLSIVASSFSTFFYPAIGAYVPNLTEDERQLGPANSAWASLDNLGFVIGPVLGGLLVATGGVTFAFVINAATFLVIAAVLWRLPPSRNVNDPKAADAISAGEPASAATDAPPADVGRMAGLPPLAPLVGIAMTRFVDGLIFGGVGILTVILATDILQAGEAATGYLNAAIGVGGVAGALISGLLVLRRSLAVPLLGGAAAVAIGSLLLGFAEVLVAAIVAIVFVSAGHLVLDVIATTLLQRVTTDAVRGRAVGAMMTIETAAEALGSLLLPVMVTGIGGIVVLGGAAALMVAVAGLALVLLRPVLTRPESPFDAIVRRVAQLPLFTGVSPASLERVLGQLEPLPVMAGQTVIRQGDAADRFYIVASGSFDVEQLAADGTLQHLRRLGPDTVFGELGLLTGAPRSATVTAREDGVVLGLSAPAFLDLVGSASVVRRRMLELYEPVGEGR
ncbi:MAG: MFS transporter [Chloroflexi bacterium]|nr:MFS transporter [Chloroflexota bacterium]